MKAKEHTKGKVKCASQKQRTTSAAFASKPSGGGRKKTREEKPRISVNRKKPKRSSKKTEIKVDKSRKRSNRSELCSQTMKETNERTFREGSTTPPLSRGNIAVVPAVSVGTHCAHGRNQQGVLAR